MLCVIVKIGVATAKKKHKRKWKRTVFTVVLELVSFFTPRYHNLSRLNCQCFKLISFLKCNAYISIYCLLHNQDLFGCRKILFTYFLAYILQMVPNLGVWHLSTNSNTKIKTKINEIEKQFLSFHIIYVLCVGSENENKNRDFCSEIRCSIENFNLKCFNTYLDFCRYFDIF